MLTVYPIPALGDNYFWLLQPEPHAPTTYIIDPGAADPVVDALKAHHLQLAGIIITHHHHDHIDGINALVDTYNIPVYGPNSVKIPQVTHRLGEGDELQLPQLTLKVLALPGHTLDHLAYLYHPPKDTAQASSLFCGDTLFAGGCGRIFDASASQLYDSFMRLASLDDNTLVYCAHEYTLTNLHFAHQIEPNNTALQTRLKKVAQMRHQGLATIPTSIGLEKKTNPYLRTHLTCVREAAERYHKRKLTNPRDVFIAIRTWKDQFREDFGVI